MDEAVSLLLNNERIGKPYIHVDGNCGTVEGEQLRAKPDGQGTVLYKYIGNFILQILAAEQGKRMRLRSALGQHNVGRHLSG